MNDLSLHFPWEEQKLLPLNHRGLYKRTLTLGGLCETAEDASRLTFSVLDIWFSSAFPNLVTGKADELFTSYADVRTFAAELAELPFIEAAFWLSCGYASWVGKDLRKLNAMFFTPPKLAEHLIESLVLQGASLDSNIWFDPACGGAAFIAPLALRMRSHLLELGHSPDQILDKVVGNIVGIEIDKTLQILSSMFVRAAVNAEALRTGREIIPRIEHGNTLTKPPDGFPHFDVLICNPPYRKLLQHDREQILESYLGHVEGQHNLYAVFMAAAAEASPIGAILGLLTPTSYMSGRHFSKLRKFLFAKLEISRVDLLKEKDSTFVQVEQETAILIARRNNNPFNSELAVNVLSSVENVTQLGKVKFAADGAPWYVPKSAREFLAFVDTSCAPHRLIDYGYIAKIGPLVWNRDKRKKLFTNVQIQAASSPVPVVWSSNITGDGVFEFGRAAAQKDFFSFIEIGDLSASGLVKSECVVLQRVTSAEQPKRLVAAAVSADFMADHGCFIAENHVVTLIPTMPLIAPKMMAELLMSEHVDSLFRCMSGTIGVTVFELNALPLPDPKKLLAELAMGKTIAEAIVLAYPKIDKEPEHPDGSKP